MNANKHVICFDLANFDLSKKYITTLQLKKMNQLLVRGGGGTYFNNIISITFYTSEFDKLFHTITR